MCGPFSRNLAGNQRSQVCAGSTTWSSTLMILGITGVADCPPGFAAVMVIACPLRRLFERIQYLTVRQVDMTPITLLRHPSDSIETGKEMTGNLSAVNGYIGSRHHT